MTGGESSGSYGASAPYATCESYAQPQKQDWPVYDSHQGIYVPWSAETSQFESMLELGESECKQIRCVSIFCKAGQERGKTRRGPHFNYKKLSIAMARWEEQLAIGGVRPRGPVLHKNGSMRTT